VGTTVSPTRAIVATVCRIGRVRGNIRASQGWQRSRRRDYTKVNPSNLEE
jgi:hypothetical protein